MQAARLEALTASRVRRLLTAVRRRPADPRHLAVSLLPAAGLACVLWLLLAPLGRGFDITDESFYLLWAADPGGYRASASQFGHYTGLLYQLAGGDLFGFRLAGVVVLLAAAGLFAAALEGALDASAGAASRAGDRLARICIILSSALLYYGSWLPTPSYNWLTLVGLLLADAGLLLATWPPRRMSGWLGPRYSPLFPGSALVAVGGVLAFMAKPPSGAALAGQALLWVILAEPLRRAWLAFLASSALAAALLVAAHVLLFEESLGSLLSELWAGARLLELQDAGHTLPASARRLMTGVMELPGVIRRVLGWWWWCALLFACAARWLARVAGSRGLAGATAATLFALWLRSALADVWRGGANAAHLLGPGLLALLFGIAVMTGLVILVNGSSRALPSQHGSRRVSLLLILLCLLGPLIYSFGSNNPLRRQMWGACVFFAAAALPALGVLEELLRSRLATAIFCALMAVGSIGVLHGAREQPYRLPTPVSGQDQPVPVGMRRDRVEVDARTRRYFEQLQELAGRAGFRAGTPLIDLTGGSPGAAYVLGARTPGIPWLAGSVDFVLHALRLEPETSLRRAWVLTSPTGRSQLPSTLLRDLGLPFPEGYLAVAQLKTGYRSEAQILWRPAHG